METTDILSSVIKSTGKLYLSNETVNSNINVLPKNFQNYT